ncbi:unnamed protein product [Rotaria socialis]|uniref:LIM zinc-binding domain-containing protein n=1 Tax=Rotaria socialis TaxID=392032 RepID=A0A820BI98_9BILA|nr:unnamed protein product [Rotaria socialis]CAF3720913.1 unnamed protein product [Rotaria socialis]CAF3790531.1 unnamed protein product [Rotaria socialis]CAF4199329.1 unnamed protein product [Rotaria socialis]CAF4571729.1 unnamed protein product [Rotaria socialis]
MICPKCGRSLLAREGILQAGRKYHRHCWTCAQCSSPLTPWVRQQPITNEYLCNACHISKNGLREGMIYVNWQKQTQSLMTSNTTPSNVFDDILLI